MNLRFALPLREVPRVPICAAFIALSLFIGGCGGKEKQAEPIVSVQVAPVRTGAISQIIAADAVAYPLQQAVISPKITSTIKTFLVQRGSRVRKGQLLAVLENADLSAAAEQSKGEFEQAQAGYATTTGASLPEQIQKSELDAAAAKAAFEAQQKVYASRNDLFDQGAIPRRDLDAAEVSLASTRSQYEQAQKQLDDLRRIGKDEALKSASGQLMAAKGKYLGAQAQLSYSELRSPIDGVVTERPLFPGELASANQPLLTVMDTSRIIAKMHIAQPQASQIKVGDSATLTIPATNDEFPARVSLVSPALDQGSTTVEVWVETTGAQPSLKPGVSVRAAITAQTVNNALIVPSNAVFKSPEGKDYVVLAGADGLAHAKEVEIGIRNSGDTQIVSGVNAGEKVISSGGYALPDNTRIKVEESSPSEPSQNLAPEARKPRGTEKD
jgi:multidrug efflux pump subunit AcrA (membrane-fusion protein)